MKNKLINLALLVLGTLLGSGANFLIQIYLAKKLSVIDYGFYSSILNLVNLLTPIIGFGVSSFMLKAYAEEGYDAKRWLDNVYLALLFSATLAFVILQFTGYLKNDGFNYFYIYCFFFVYMLSVSYNSFMILYFQIQGRFRFFSLWQTVPNLIKLIFILGSVTLLGSSLNSIGIAYVLTGLFVLTFSLNSLHKMKVGKIKLLDVPISLANDPVTSKALIINSIPFGLNGIFYLIYFQSTILILSFIEGYEAVAYFSLAMTLLTAFCLLPSVFFQKFLMPKIHYWAIHEKKRAYKFYIKNIVIWFFIGLVAAISNIIFAKFFLINFFGVEYLPAIKVFYLMSIVVLIKYLNLNSGALMTTKYLINIKSKIMMYAAVLNVSLSFLLITLFGIEGAVISIILVEIFISLLFVNIINRNFRGSHA
ncbi:MULTISPECIES: oligosaccharide flippase family protein [unclassified Psychrobacter]|uniref:oligosaccharide flippase family protein n=1 Tax=unclassified Psychrobacter TaxID=196806 RepID=UPI0025D0B26F|nr:MULTISPECIES: oligosaccharide flippase family protein [unclassified Psychrobacter]